MQKMNRFGHLDLKEKHNLMGSLFVLPFVIGFVFIFLPAIYQSFIYSVNELTLNADGYTMTSVGFTNYIKAFMIDPYFKIILWESLTRMSTDIPVILIFSFFMANLLNQKFVGRTAARTLFFLPVILSTGLIASVEAGNMVMDIYRSGSTFNNGMSSELMQIFDLEDMLLESRFSPQLVDIVLSSVYGLYDIVISSGVQMLVFLAGLQSISPSVFESAYVEGATKWEIFWKITLPMISPLILVNAIYTVVESFTRPSYGILEFIKEQAFRNSQYGYASALSWIYFVITGLILLVVGAILSKAVFYNE